jgi:hypothetical protein
MCASIVLSQSLKSNQNRHRPPHSRLTRSPPQDDIVGRPIGGLKRPIGITHLPQVPAVVGLTDRLFAALDQPAIVPYLPAAAPPRQH